MELDAGPAKEGHSALFGITLSPEPRPESFQITTSSLRDLRALKNLNILTPQPVDLKSDFVEPQIIKYWRPEILPPSYTLISFTIPTLTIYAITIPTTLRCLLHGKIVVRNTITAVTTFIAFMFSLKVIHLSSISHTIAVTLASLIAFLIAIIALTPLKQLGLRITNLSKQPLGWVIMTLFYTLLVANMIIHFGAELFRAQDGTFKEDHAVVIKIPYYYTLLITLAMMILAIIATNITTIAAQNAVLMTLSAYIIISGLTLIYNLLFVRFVSQDSPIALDPFLFFSSNVSVSMRKNVTMAFIILVSILSTKYHTEMDMTREAIIYPHHI